MCYLLLSSMHVFLCRFIYACVSLLVYLLTLDIFICVVLLLIHLFIHLSFHLFIHSCSNSFFPSFVHSCIVLSCIHLCIYSFIHRVCSILHIYPIRIMCEIFSRFLVTRLQAQVPQHPLSPQNGPPATPNE